MRNIINRLLLLLVIATVAFSCKDDDEFSDLVRDNRPAVPVTFPGATTYGFNPYIETSIGAGGGIIFTIAIPESSGRTIKEITKIAAGATAINAGTLNSAGYNTESIPVNGTTATFTTSLPEFNAKRPTVPTSAVAAPNFREIAFIFLITLDDDTQIITQQVRVRILP